MDYQSLDRWIDLHREEYLETLARWIAVPSVLGEAAPNAPYGKENRKMLNLAMEDARRFGFAVRDFDGHCADVTMGEGGKLLGILGHLDVVPAGDGWESDPFTLTVKDGKLFGRGVADDKGPALAAMFAMRAVRDSGFPMKNTVRMVLGCEEETGMHDMKHYAKAADRLPDFGFSPDAGFPVINIEKGGLDAVLSARADASCKEKPVLLSLYAGERPNVVPNYARAELDLNGTPFAELEEALKAACAADERMRVSVEKAEGDKVTLLAEGVSAHASLPHCGVNAAGMLLIALTAMEIGGETLRSIACLAEKIGFASDGENLGIACKDELSGALTCNLGILRYDGKTFEATIDIRHPLCTAADKLMDILSSTLAPFDMAVTKASSRPPLHVPAESEIVQKLLAAYAEVTGNEAYTIAIGGGTYSGSMPNTVAFGPHFPGDEEVCHTAFESVGIEKMFTTAKVYAHAIAHLCCE